MAHEERLAVVGYGIFSRWESLPDPSEPQFRNPRIVDRFVVFERDGGSGRASIIAGRYQQDLPKAGGHRQVEVAYLSFSERPAAERAARDAGYRPPFEFWHSRDRACL